MKTLLALCLLLWAAGSLSAQPPRPTGRIFVLHEGTASGSGEVGYWSLTCNAYTKVENLPSFGNALTALNDTLYLTDGSGNIRLYDLRTLNKIKTIENANARQLKFWKNYLLTSCNAAPYFRVYNRKDFKQIFASDSSQLTNEAEGLAVVDNHAYVAANGLNGFGVNKRVDSVIAVFDLNQMKFRRRLFSFPNPNQITEIAGKLYVQCLNYGSQGLTVTVINPATQSVEAHRQVGFLSAGGFATDGKDLFVYETDPATFAVKGIRQIDPLTFNVTEGPAGNYYGLAYLPELQRFITSSTDFFSSGSVQLVERDGSVTLSKNTAISPRAFYYQAYQYPSVEPGLLGTDTVNCDQMITGQIDISGLFPPDYLSEWSGIRNGNLLLYSSQNNNLFTLKVTSPDGCYQYNDSLRVNGLFSIRRSVLQDGLPAERIIIGKPVVIVIGPPFKVEQWILGENDIRSGGNMQEFTIEKPSEPNDFRHTIQVVVSNGSCVDTFNIHLSVFPNSVLERMRENAFRIGYDEIGNQLFVFTEEKITQITLSDLNGKTVFTSSLPENLNGKISVSVGGLPGGLYLLKVEGNKNYFEKVFLQK